jgi:hypothetical protein
MTVRFLAPVAITDAASAYRIRISKEGARRARIGVTHQNFARGELVTQRFQHLDGGGTYRITVSYHRGTEPGQWDPSGGGGVTVGASVPRPLEAIAAGELGVRGEEGAG